MLIVPGAAVLSYARPAAETLAGRGVDARLLPAPGEPGVPADLRDYGARLARRIAAGSRVELLVGLSVGAQAAAVAAAAVGSDRLGQLMLVGPTVDPQARTMPRLLGRWLAGGRVERPELLPEQAPEWRRAGLRRLARVTRSALAVRIEDLLPEVAAGLVVVHGERDVITSHAYASRLAVDSGGRLIVVPGATHSWPYADAARFADTVEAVLGREDVLG